MYVHCQKLPKLHVGTVPLVHFSLSRFAWKIHEGYDFTFDKDTFYTLQHFVAWLFYLSPVFDE